MQTASQNSQGRLFTTGDGHEELSSASYSLLPSFMTPCRGAAKWPSSLSMRADMIQMLLSIHKSSFLQAAKST